LRVWYDACTGKHVRFGTAIVDRLRSLGHEIIFTTRAHPDTVALAKLLHEHPFVVGEYEPATLSTRLEASAKRMLKFSEMFRNNPPEAAISHQSPELCRVAFGLNIPIVVTADTPYATAVNKLTLPLASVVVTSEAIPKNLFRKFGAQDIRQYRGVDEVAWTKNVEPRKTFDFERPLIVVRQIETRAAYAVGKKDVTIEAARRLSALGTVVFLSRYGKPKEKGLVVLDEFVDSASLAAQADLVVSAGGTISREAALQGTPSIVISEFDRIEVNEYLAKKGFPIFLVKPSKVVETAKKHLGNRLNVKAKIAELEDPVEVIREILTEKQFT